MEIRRETDEKNKPNPMEIRRETDKEIQTLIRRFNNLT